MHGIGNRHGFARVVPIASPLFTSFGGSRTLGEATRRAIAIPANGLRSSPAARCRIGSGRTRSWAERHGRDCQRVQSPGRPARARTLAEPPLPRIPRHASGLRVNCNGEGGMADTIHAVRRAWLVRLQRSAGGSAIFSVVRQRPGQCRISRQRQIQASPPLSPRARFSTLALRARHAELPAADFGEHRDALADLLMRRAREAQPQPAAGCRPCRSTIPAPD